MALSRGKRVERHVLGFEWSHVETVLSQYATQRRHGKRLAGVRSRAQNHQCPYRHDLSFDSRSVLMELSNSPARASSVAP